jgi:hypothetical protein
LPYIEVEGILTFVACLLKVTSSKSQIYDGCGGADENNYFRQGFFVCWSAATRLLRLIFKTAAVDEMERKQQLPLEQGSRGLCTTMMAMAPTVGGVSGNRFMVSNIFSF